MRIIITYCLLLTITLLTACATLPTKPQPAAQNNKIAWTSRAKSLSDVQSWDIKALMGVRKQQDAWSATLQWHQQHQTYHISLFGPLGTPHYELSGQPGFVQLSDAKGKTVSASNPEALLRQQTGSELPVSNLFYWIRGLPVPSLPAQKEFDRYNHLVSLTQDGWTIHYLRYTSVNQVDVPNKIFLSNASLTVKIIINQWQF